MLNMALEWGSWLSQGGSVKSPGGFPFTSMGSKFLLQACLVKKTVARVVGTVM